ncbi:CMD domain protein [Comamonas sp. 4034]|uniref:CMD domain protein n=1 Tax=Comamonas sp. 4034 TaxID=3156455 RepID=UPI003D1D70C8
MTTPVTDDLIDQLVGLAPGSRTYAARHQREKVAAATQGSYNALFDPALPDLTLTERLLVALYASRLTPAPELAAHYRERLQQAQADAALIQVAEADEPQDAQRLNQPRLAAILSFTRTLIEKPVEGDKAALLALPAAGISTPAVVALSQLIAFLSYQVRLVAGLKAMKASEEAHA